jgi:hypothetical protein
MEAEEFLFAFARGANNNEGAFNFRLHPPLQIHPFSRDVGCAAGGTITPTLMIIILLLALD